MQKNKLNKAQEEAVLTTDKPLLIVAGAGTGKTTVITQKIAYLIEKELAKPEEILALTFTDKAAEEMIERVDNAIDRGYAEMHISTFHAFCQKILQQYALDIGLPNHFKLLTQTDAWLLVKENLDKFNLDYYRPMGNPTRHIHELINHFGKCKDELISPQEYFEYAENLQLESGDANTDEKSRLTELANAYHTYNQILLDNVAMDFADLIFYTYKLFQERPNILKAVQEKFKFVLVDEFQDVNYSQYELVKLIADNNKTQLIAVGDDDQSIYAFRGASVANIMRFKDDFPNSQQIVLRENYRSGQEILDIAYKSVQNNNPDRLEEKLKIDKKLEAKNEKLKAEIKHLHAQTIDEEVRSVVEEIKNLKSKDKNVSWDDFAILVRANNHAEPFLEALDRADIPYEFLASSGLYKQPVVMDCINFFKVLYDHTDSTAIFRLLNLPFLNFYEGDLARFISNAKKKSTPYFYALDRVEEYKLSASGIKVVGLLRHLLNKGLNSARYEKPSVVLYEFLEKSGYLTYLTEAEEKGDRDLIRQIYQLKQFLDYIASFEAIVPGAKVADFVEHYLSLQQAGDDGQMYQPTDTPDSVNVMTIHASKGLEYRFVFMVNMVEDRFPSRKKSEPIEIPKELIKEQLPEGDIHIQEERRLFYVAATRAKEKLYLASADNYGGVRNKKLSRFLAEIFDIKDNKAKPVEKKLLESLLKNKTIEKSKSEFVYNLPKAFSYSQIRSYQTCPYQYKLAHILKIPLKGSASFSFGTSMHNTLQAFYEKVQELNTATQASLFGEVIKRENNDSNITVPTLEELFEMYHNNWIEDWYSSKKQREDYYKKGKDILKTFYASHDGNWTMPISLESWFKVKIGDYFVHGRIDRVDQLEDGTLEIIDYKTGKSKEKLVGDDKDQLLIYQIAAETLPEYKNVGATSKLTFYYLNDEVKTSFVGNDKDLQRVRDKITKTIDGIYAKDFKATPNKIICGRCDFRDICKYRA